MKFTELVFAGEVLRPANLDDEALKVVLSRPNEYVMVRDKDGRLRVLKAKK